MRHLKRYQHTTQHRYGILLIFALCSASVVTCAAHSTPSSPPSAAASTGDIGDTSSTRAEYNSQAAQWLKTSENVGSWDAEQDTLRAMLGYSLLHGKTVVDVACGAGRSTRVFAAMQPTVLYGIDLSTENLRNAREIEKGNSGGKSTSTPITYLQHDMTLPVTSLPRQHFDVVSASYLLSYSQSKTMLFTFVRHLFALVAPGGVYVGLEDNPRQNPTLFGRMKPWGYIKTTANPPPAGKLMPEGGVVTYVVGDGKDQFTSNVWVWKAETYAQAFAEAGFIDFEWFPLTVDPRRDHTAKQRLAGLLRLQPVIGLRAKRPSQRSEL